MSRKPRGKPRGGEGAAGHPSVLEIFRTLAPAFSEVPGETVNAWIALTEPLVGRRVFGGLHSQALALLTAHRMEMSGLGCAEPGMDGQIGKIGALKRAGVASFSEGQTSISLSHGAGRDGELGMTEYGKQFMMLRRKRVVPIVSAAERGR